ncbi:hypothetical protein [Haloferula helveola]
MLRLPEAGEETPPLVTSGSRRRRRSEPSKSAEDRRAEKVFDETFAHKQGADTTVGRMVAASVITVIVLLLVGIFWPRDDKPPADAGPGAGAEPPSNVEPVPQVPEEKLELVTPETIRDDLEPVAKAFLRAKDPEEALKWVRHPEKTRKRMETFHEGRFRSKGFRSVSLAEVFPRGDDWAKILVEVEDFTRVPMWLVKDDGWKVDWESWVGWSPTSWEKIRERRPTGPFKLRATVSPVIYYNFRFKNETEWACYALASPDGESTIYGYAPRGGEVHSSLGAVDTVRGSRMLLEVRYPDNSASDNQVLIDRVVCEGWLDLEDGS